MIKSGQFWYLGTPYTKFPGGLECAFVMACKLTAFLAARGVPVYSPIAHSHPVAVHGALDAVDHHFWVRFDRPMVEAAGGLIAVMAEGWEESRGLKHEIEQFKLQGKPVLCWDPATKPDLDSMLSTTTTVV